MDGDANADFEAEIERRAPRFELKPLLDLLRAKGYRRDELLFESSSGGASRSIVEAVRFEHAPSRRVRVTLNIGLLGDGSLLPSYFFEVIEGTEDPARFYDFIRYFDHHLISNLVTSLYPEDNRGLFRDWGATKQSFLRMLGVGSPSTLAWLVQLFFPELRVSAERQAFSQDFSSHAFRPGQSTLDGTGVLGGAYEATADGLVVDLVADEETDARGRNWAKVVRTRLNERLLPVLADFRLSLMVRLTVLTHASWVRVEGPAASTGYLGYDRLVEDAESGHTVLMFRGVTSRSARA